MAKRSVESPSPAAKRAATGWCAPEPTLLLRSYGAPDSKAIFAFDLDDTLIKTKSGKTFATSSDDWTWWDAAVPSRLKTLSAQGAKLVVFTNQRGYGGGKPTKEFTDKVDQIQADLGLPLLVIAALGDDLFRKPRLGSWRLMAKEYNGGQAPDPDRCAFVGDAAGRPAVKKVKKDFSDTDLKFALNLGVRFHTPEEFFLGEAAAKATGRSYSLDFDFDPRKLGATKAAVVEVAPAKSQELILVVGPPGSGKSSMAASKFTGYVRVNQDTLKSKEKCLKAVQEALKAGHSAIVDNQNKDKATRKSYLDLAKAARFLSVP